MQALVLERKDELVICDIGASQVDLAPLVTATYAFADSMAAFRRAAEGRPGDVKTQIVVNDGGRS